MTDAASAPRETVTCPAGDCLASALGGHLPSWQAFGPFLLIDLPRVRGADGAAVTLEYSNDLITKPASPAGRMKELRGPAAA